MDHCGSYVNYGYEVEEGIDPPVFIAKNVINDAYAAINKLDGDHAKNVKELRKKLSSKSS